MNLKEIKEELLRAAALVEDFEKNHLEIDRDAALNKIRQAYEELRFIDVILVDEPTTEPVAPFVPEEDDEPEIEVEFIMPENDENDENDEEESEEQTEQTTEEPEQVVYVAEEEETEPEVEVKTEVMPEIEPVAEPEPEPITEPEPIAEPEPIVEDEPEIEVVVEEDFDIDEAFEPELNEPEVTPEPEEPEVATEPEPEVEPTPEPKRVIVEQSLFGDYEPVVKKATPSRRKIMALYEDEPAAAPTPKVESVVEPAAEPIAEPEPITEPTPEPAAEPVVMPVLEGENKVLGEVITPTTTIADTIAPVVSVAEDRPVDTLRGAINVVDRFMLIRDLFDDDAELYEQTIDELEKMDNLDDCIIYIAENFAWRPSSEGAKLMMDLLQRKLG